MSDLAAYFAPPGYSRATRDTLIAARLAKVGAPVTNDNAPPVKLDWTHPSKWDAGQIACAAFAMNVVAWVLIIGAALGAQALVHLIKGAA